MAATALNVSSGGGRKRGRRRPIMSDINVTPFVDVMLVLLIVFMVSAPLLTVGVPIELPQSQAKALGQDKEPLTLSVNVDGKIFLQSDEVKLDDLVPKLKAVIEARGLVNTGIEIRQDLITDQSGQQQWAERLARILGEIEVVLRAQRKI